MEYGILIGIVSVGVAYWFGRKAGINKQLQRCNAEKLKLSTTWSNKYTKLYDARLEELNEIETPDSVIDNINLGDGCSKNVIESGVRPIPEVPDFTCEDKNGNPFTTVKDGVEIPICCIYKKELNNYKKKVKLWNDFFGGEIE